MPDYKKIIADAKNAVSDTVKSVNVSAVKDIYVRGAERAKAYARITKLNIELNSDYEDLQKVYTEIGKLYYEEACGEPDGIYAPLFANIEQLRESAKIKEQEISDLKASVESGPAAGEAPDFEDIVSRTENDGRNG